MKTFCAVDDAALVRLVSSAKRRIVFVAPGLTLAVANALGQRFDEIDGLDITVVLDADEDVCRIGYGEVAALQRLHALAQRQGFWLKSQPGLRVGVLLSDDQTLAWARTPRSVEAPPESEPTSAPSQASMLDEPPPLAPNGLLLGINPGEQLASAVAAEGTATGPADAEIGRSAITPAQVQQTVEAHLKNPPIPVDLARVTRVFSTKLQFVEIKVTRAKLSQSRLSVPNELLNADVKGELERLLASALFPFDALRDEPINVPAFVNGVAAMGADGNPLMEPVSESKLERQRRDLERDFVYDITGFGRLIEKDRKPDFQMRLVAYAIQLKAHSEGVRALLEQQAQQILDDAVDLIMTRSQRAPAQAGGLVHRPDARAIREQLQRGLERVKAEAPSLSLVFKDVTYEQTQSPEFRDKVNKALPGAARKRLGKWSDQFDAAKRRTEEAGQDMQKGAR